MKTLAKVWFMFMLSNMIPIGHVSDVKVPRCNLLFSMIQDDYTINISKNISDELQ